MEAVPLPPRLPPCGLTRQEVERYHVEGICTIADGGLCQNLRPDETVCNRPITAHPSETAPTGKMTPPNCYKALSLH